VTRPIGNVLNRPRVLTNSTRNAVLFEQVGPHASPNGLYRGFVEGSPTLTTTYASIGTERVTSPTRSMASPQEGRVPGTENGCLPR
jgi:hypothetical protein